MNNRHMTATWRPASAKWIWAPGDPRPGNAYVYFRRTLSLDRIPAQATLHVSADCRYRLIVNGGVIGQGPVTTDPKYKQIDIYDVRQFLRPGANILAALVLQRHNKNARFWPVRGGFLLQLDADPIHLGTDGTWKARWAQGYKPDTPYMTHQYGQQEWFDARLDPAGWETPGFDDSDWVPATEVDHASDFWPEHLEIRTVPHMLRERIRPVRIVSFYGLASPTSPEQEHEPAHQLEVDYVLSAVVARSPENLLRSGSGPAVFQANTGDGVGIVLDLGEEMFGYPFLDIECPAGITVDIGHGELLSRNRIQTDIYRESPAEQRYADRYVTRDGRQRFEIFDTKGCQYLQVHFRRIPRSSNGTASITIHEIGFIRSRAPLELRTEFTCSDNLLNRIFDICARTAEVICQDWHICDAQREQDNFVELFQDMLMMQVYGRVEMLRQTIHMFVRGQLPSGFILSTIPTINEGNQTPDKQYIFCSYALPLVIYLDWLYGGPDDRQPEWLDACIRIFDGLFQYQGPHGTLANTPGSHWIEWTGLDARPGDCGRPVKNSWEVTFFCGLLVLGLECLADMAAALGRAETAADWRTRAARLRAAAERYWSKPRGAFVDGIYDGAPSDTVSQTTNAAAILARLSCRENLLQAAHTIRDPGTFDVPSGINTMALYHEGLESLNVDGSVPNRIRTIWKTMLDHGATTTWESPQTPELNLGCCFGFGAHPLNYMVRNFLGIIPLEPGYRLFSVRIATHDLSFAKGKIATPNGPIEIAWEKTNAALVAHLTVPPGCQAVIAAPRQMGSSEAVSVIIDGSPAPLTPGPVALGSFRRETLPTHRVGPGHHEIRFTAPR